MKNKKLIPLFIVLSLFGALSIRAVFPPGLDRNTNSSGSSFGDIDHDGETNIFDLLLLLKHLSGTRPYSATDDVDKNGQVDVMDLLALVQLLAAPEKPELELQVALVIHNHLLNFCETVMDVAFPHSPVISEGEIALSYHIYANKEIKEVEFIIGGDTLWSIQGLTPPIPINLNDTIKTTQHYLILFTSVFIPWSIKITDIKGNNRKITGQFKLIVEAYTQVVLVDYFLYFLTGFPIDFPLILRGPFQKFALEVFNGSRKKMTVDLNRAGADSVIFNSIQELAEAISEDLAAHDSTWQADRDDRSIALPAVVKETGEHQDRLIIVQSSFQGLLIHPVDENEELLEKLGFPGWIREFLPYQSPCLSYDLDWFLKYYELYYPIPPANKTEDY